MTDRAGRDLTGPVVAALDVYDAALVVVASWLDLLALEDQAAPAGSTDPVAALEAAGAAHDDAVRALAVTLERVGVLDRATSLDPAAVLRLSPPIRPDPPGVIGSAPDGG